MSKTAIEDKDMRSEYDFSNARSNPYVKKIKQQVTIRLDTETIEYFKNLSVETGVPYQTLINLYLSDCVRNERTLTFA